MISIGVKFPWALFGVELGSIVGVCVGESEEVMIGLTVGIEEEGDEVGERINVGIAGASGFGAVKKGTKFTAPKTA